VQVTNALEIPGGDLGSMPALPELPEFRLDHYLPAATKLPVTAISRGMGSLFGRWGFYLGARRTLRDSPAVAVIRCALYDHITAIGTWRVAALRGLLDAFGAQRSRLEERICEISSARQSTADDTDEWCQQLQADISRLHEPSVATGQPMPDTSAPSSESATEPDNHPRRSGQ
jgi:hypothetical protein